MTIDELQQLCQAAKDSGIPGDSEVKLFNRDAPTLCHVIAPVVDSQLRRVQCYDLDGKDYRNKYLLLASTSLDGIGAS
jgi:hypothetical protein